MAVGCKQRRATGRGQRCGRAQGLGVWSEEQNVRGTEEQKDFLSALQ